jgi:hypothetical protein
MHYFYYLKLKTIYNISNTKFSCLVGLLLGQLSKKIWFKDAPEDGARLAPKHVG